MNIRSRGFAGIIFGAVVITAAASAFAIMHVRGASDGAVSEAPTTGSTSVVSRAAPTSSVPSEVTTTAGPVDQITWDGYHGVKLGEDLHAAAKTLGVTMRNHCGRYDSVATNTVAMDDEALTDGRVDTIGAIGKGVPGPNGVRLGMTIAQARHALGPESGIRNPDDVISYYWIGPEGHTLFVESTGEGVGRVEQVILAVNLKVAQFEMDNRGGC